MITLYFILFLFGFICFILTAVGTKPQRVNLLALGLAFWVLVPLIQSFQKL